MREPPLGRVAALDWPPMVVDGEYGVATGPGNPTTDTPARLSARDRLVPWFSITERFSSAIIVLSITCCLPLGSIRTGRSSYWPSWFQIATAVTPRLCPIRFTYNQ